MTENYKLIRGEFPLLNNRRVIYLDNSATSQKPNCVIDAVRAYYERNNANPMRGLYELSLDATNAYEKARQAAADFISAPAAGDVIFTRNATESINLVAYSYGMNFIGPGDEIIVDISEHHSNMLPWQQVAARTGASLRYYECEKDGEAVPEKIEAMMNRHTRLIAIAQISNVFGRLNDIKTIARIAHEHGAVVVCDGAQSVPHVPVDVRDLDVDFLAFSGHKMFAPMGIGVLYGKRELLEAMPPFLYGGEMIEYVTTEGATYAEVPHKFEAGTVNDGGAVGLSAAIDFINRWGWDIIEKRERILTAQAMERIREMPHVHMIGAEDPADHHGIITFTIDGVHPHDVAAIFDADGIAVRAGHHCAQPLHKYLGLMSTTRASLAFYNTQEDIEAFTNCLATIRRRMGYAE